MLPRPFASLATVLVLLLLPALVAPQAFAQKGDRVKLKGKVKTVSEKQMAIEEKPETDYLIHINSRTRVTVEGTAVPEYLAPGVDVQVVADVNKAGVVPEPLTEITVCTFNESNPATFGPEDPTKPSRKGKDAVNRFVIRGTIKTIRNGKLTIATPDKLVKATLTPDAKIKVLSTDVTWAQVGDEASVAGVEIFAGEVQAQTLKVALAKPLEPKKPEGAKHKKTAGR
ncbi:MAG TPA: hypothetical protein VHV55_00795 [Pirellulales bacterium]|jgi:hypothetical protein|nr:hypothetical protein [Pirellulales bacterium]